MGSRVDYLPPRTYPGGLSHSPDYTIGTHTMNLKVLAASLLFIAIMAAAISTNFSGFIDAIPEKFVLVGALCFGIYANGEWKLSLIHI